MWKRGLLFVVLVGCRRPPPPPPPPGEAVLAFEVAAPPVVVADDNEVVRNQPPDIKLRLGHYRNRARGVGVTIDRTAVVPPGVIAPARLRYDGTDRVIELDGQPGTTGRIDYLERTRLVMQVYDTGRIELWVYGAAGAASGPIEVERDGDADRL